MLTIYKFQLQTFEFYNKLICWCYSSFQQKHACISVKIGKKEKETIEKYFMKCFRY